MNKPHKHAETIKAWADGAEIQCFNEATGKWVDVHNQKSPFWTEDVKYRIKPQPKLVPFTFEDSSELVGRKVKTKREFMVGFITGIINRPKMDCTICIGPVWVSYKQLLDEYVFHDGSPCGKISE